MMGVNLSGDMGYSNEDRTTVQSGMEVVVCKQFKVSPCVEFRDVRVQYAQTVLWCK